MRSIKDYDSSKGFAFQGDVSIIPISADIAIDRSDEIAPTDGRLILQEGEVSGHHHAIDLRERPSFDKPSSAVERMMADASAGKIPLPTAKLYRDPTALAEMLRRQIITRTDLAVGVLVIEVGPMCLTHEEHDGIRIPPGTYLIGRQVESAGAEERRVMD
jgi:hypothetical protein